MTGYQVFALSMPIIAAALFGLTGLFVLWYWGRPREQSRPLMAGEAPVDVGEEFRNEMGKEIRDAMGEGFENALDMAEAQLAEAHRALERARRERAARNKTQHEPITR
jgi:hypothetical protein